MLNFAESTTHNANNLHQKTLIIISPLKPLDQFLLIHVCTSLKRNYAKVYLGGVCKEKLPKGYSVFLGRLINHRIITLLLNDSSKMRQVLSVKNFSAQHFY